MFVCTPWGQVAVFNYWAEDCSDPKTMQYVSLVEGLNNNCASKNYCYNKGGLYMKVQANKITSVCVANETNYEQNAFVPGCTDQEIGSTLVECNAEKNTIGYTVFSQPGMISFLLFSSTLQITQHQIR